MKITLVSIILATIILVGTIFVTGASDISNSFNEFSKSSELDKSYRDFILTTIPTTYNSKGGEITKEIKPVINIDCSDRECKYSAVQDGIINSYDNIIDRYYCIDFDIINSTCRTEKQYTTSEIENIVSTQVNNKLTVYANSSIERINKPYTKISTGVITINEK